MSVIPLTEYESEHRLAVVMYGGVSLAIYIGGVARELLGVVRATAPSADDSAVAGLSDDELTAAERIYRRIAQASEGAATFAAAPSGSSYQMSSDLLRKAGAYASAKCPRNHIGAAESMISA